MCCIFATVPGCVAFLSHILRALLNQNKFIMCLIILYDLVSLVMETNQDKQQKEDKMNNSNAYKYEEIKEHFEDFIKDQNKDWIKENFDDLHHHAFNNDYYIIGTYQAKKWLGDEVFEIINIIKEYENDNFGEVNTDFSDPEKVVNMYTYIIGEDVVNNWKTFDKREVA